MAIAANLMAIWQSIMSYRGLQYIFSAEAVPGACHSSLALWQVLVLHATFHDAQLC